MANFTTKYTRTINQEFKGRCLRAQVSAVGSFMAVRVEDPEGIVPLKTFQELAFRVGQMLQDDGIVANFHPNSIGYTYNGCVANWTRE